MTKQPIRPARYYPGKAVAEDLVSDDESDEDDEAEEDQDQAAPEAAPAQSEARSLPSLHRPLVAPRASVSKPEDDLEGFVTASESSDAEGDESGSEDEESSGEEDSSSDDEPRKPMLAPKFVSKAKRAQLPSATISEEQKAEDEARARKEKADEVLQAQIERETAARKAGKKAWDDEDIPDEEVDDRDDIDPEAELAAWKLRELRRVQRDRNALIAKEKERDEIERRRNMTAEEREAEDRTFIEQQTEERENKGKMNYMQKYFHKGAYHAGDDLDEDVKAALNRDVAGRRFEDEAGDKSVLPEYMKIRDATKLGKKGRTRYKDLQSEDTGRWGEFGKKRAFDGLDERFRPDENGGGRERTGANSQPVGERRRRDDDGDRGEEKRPRHD